MNKLDFRPMDVNKEALIDELVEDGVLRDFFIQNDLDTDYIEQHLSTLFNFKIEKDRCLDCQGIHECKQDVLGHEPVLVMEDFGPKSYYRLCGYAVQRRQKQTQDANLGGSRLGSVCCCA